MNIAGYAEKINSVLAPYTRLITIVLLAFMCLGLCTIWQEKTIKTALAITMSADPSLNGQATDVYASKTGTKYYFPWCGALNRIKPENRVEFASAALAQVAGMQPAANCKGLK